MLQELNSTLDQMHPHKALGPDGYSPMFYQTYWSLVGQDVSQYLLQILNGGDDFLEGLNDTHIVLILKVPKPHRALEFRPINLCNVM